MARNLEWTGSESIPDIGIENADLLSINNGLRAFPEGCQKMDHESKSVLPFRGSKPMPY
jgi:hypothetical protein